MRQILTDPLRYMYSAGAARTGIWSNPNQNPNISTIFAHFPCLGSLAGVIIPYFSQESCEEAVEHKRQLYRELRTNFYDSSPAVIGQVVVAGYITNHGELFYQLYITVCPNSVEYRLNSVE